MRTCLGCNKELTGRPDKKYCKKGCGRVKTPARVASQHTARTGQREAHVLKFVGCDGEGITLPNGDHHYVLLSLGDKSLHRNGRHLTFTEIMEFLWNNKVKDAVHVGFFLGYDFTQWLSTLPEDRAAALITDEGIASRVRKNSGGNPTPFPVQYQDWEFDMMGLKRFKLRPRAERGEKGEEWMWICDTGSFFQSSFLTVLNPKGWPNEPICTPEEYAVIVEGKDQRSTAQFDTAMIRYNVLENELLGRVMTHYNAGLVNADIRLKENQWFGPGQAAQQWLYNIKAPKNDIVYPTIPKPAILALQGSMYGGWFEIFGHGHIPGEVEEDDVNSAYPHEIASLPCLLHGKWKHGENRRWEAESSPYVLVHATVTSYSAILGAAPHRLADGRILRPRVTRGWYWKRELDALTWCSYDVDEYWVYDPCDCPPPFESIRELYQRRLDAGKNSPEGKALKLVYNSSYGKMAQSVGHPVFSNFMYASLITSGCRTAIANAIASHPDPECVVMVATDGVYFRQPHPTLDKSPTELGKWDSTTKKNMTLFMPGVYWDDKTRAALAEGIAPSMKSRGISGKALGKRLRDIDTAFDGFRGEGEWPSFEIPYDFGMITPKQALIRHAWEDCGRVLTDYGKRINSDPSAKRGTPYWAGDMVRTRVRDVDDIQTTPFQRSVGLDPEILMPDGNETTLLTEMLRAT